MPSFTVVQAASPDDLAEIARLFAAYGASLEVDLAYQDFDDELAGLPGKYAPPSGALLLARRADGAAVGCIGLRDLGGGACEMKRLYVSPEGRGLGLGRSLMQGAIDAARDRGYREMRLDTLPSMAAAQGLYRQVGFEPIAPYYATPVAGTLFMRKRL